MDIIVQSMYFIMMRLFVLINFFVLHLLGCTPRIDHEAVQDRYPNGNPRKVYCFDERGEMILVKTFHYNAIRESEQEFRGGKPNGLTRRWGSNGVLQETSEYSDGVREGLSDTWYTDYRRESTAQYHKGVLEGELTILYPSGKRKEVQYWSLGKPVGTWTTYYPDGAVESSNSCNLFEIHGRRVSFSKTNQILSEQLCAHGIPEGDTIANYGDGTPRFRGQMHSGKPTGTWQWQRADKTVQLVAHFQDGLRHGAWIRTGPRGDTLWRALFLHGTGRISSPCPMGTWSCAESTWVNGQLDGNVIAFFPEKLLRSRDFWTSGQLYRSEVWKTDTLGMDQKLLLKGDWNAGKREGIWRTWFASGGIKDSLHYQNGELWGEQNYFDSTGHLYMTRQHSGKFGQVIVKKLDPRIEFLKFRN